MSKFAEGLGIFVLWFALALIQFWIAAWLAHKYDSNVLAVWGGMLGIFALQNIGTQIRKHRQGDRS